MRLKSKIPLRQLFYLILCLIKINIEEVKNLKKIRNKF